MAVSSPGRTHILVADGDALFRAVLCDLLDNEGIHVLAAANGEDALDAAAEHHPKVIAVDLDLPGTGAEHVIRRIKRTPGSDAVHVIAWRGTSVDRSRRKEIGADDYLVKGEFEAFWTELCAILNVCGAGRCASGANGQPKRRYPLSAPTIGALLAARQVEPRSPAGLTEAVVDDNGGRLFKVANPTTEARLNEKIRNLEFLRDLTELARSKQPEEVIFSSLLEKSVDSLRAEAGTIALCEFGDTEPADLVFFYTCGENASALQGMRLSGNTGIVGWVVANDRPALVNDVNHDPRFYRSIDQAHDFTTRSLLCAPLKSGEKTIGAIEIVNRREGRFDEDDLTLLETIVNMTAQIIKQVQDEASLQENEQRHRLLLQSSPDPIAVFDRQNRITYVNSAFVRTFGHREEALIGRPMDITRDADLDRIDAAIEQMLRDGRDLSLEARAYRSDGEPLDIQLRAALLAGKNDTGQGYILVLRDITQTRQLEKQLAHAQRMESLGTLASGIAHNFRNMMFGILGNSQLIEMKSANAPELGTHAARITDIVMKGTDLVKTLMQFSRKERQADLVLIDLAEVIQDACAIIQESIDKRITVKTDLPVPLPINGDRSDLTQVFVNLGTNARDAMDEGGELVISGRHFGDRVTVTVSDTGCGMDEATQNRIFDPFYTTKQEGLGTGLGLSTAFGSVKKHAGRIDVFSAPGKGARFTLEFPSQADPKFEVPAAENATVPGSWQKILIVDDELAFLEPIRESLERLGYRVHTADSGERGIYVYLAWRPDVVLLDRNMPGMDGNVCLDRLLSVDPEAKIVFISGYDPDGPEGIRRDTADKIKGYMVKPLEIGSLSRLLKEII